MLTKHINPDNSESTVWIDETASVGHNVAIGKGVMICYGAVVENGVHIGENTVICDNATVERGSVIGSQVLIGVGASVGCFARVEDWAYIDDGEIVGASTVIQKKRKGKVSMKHSYSASEIAYILDVSVSTIYRWKDKGMIPWPFKYPGQMRWTANQTSAILDWHQKRSR